MFRHRLFVANDLRAGAVIPLNTSQAHYLLHVLRLGQGSTLLVFDGKHGEWLAEIVTAKKASCQIKVIEKIRGQTATSDVHYAFAPLKQARLDYLIQKAVEMGAALLQPVLTAHSAVGRINLARMQANAIEAAEQCGILTLPQIQPPVKLAALLSAHPSERAIVFCDEGAPAGSPLDTLHRVKERKVMALVGPEGGFAEEERELLLTKDFVYRIWLGPRIMRADTAAVAILALINTVLGDWR